MNIGVIGTGLMGSPMALRLLSVTNGEAVRSLLEAMGLDNGEASLAHKAIIQMGTIAPTESQQLSPTC